MSESFERKLRKNIPLLAYLQAINTANLFMAVVVPYWNSLGLNQANIFMLQVVFLITVVVLEVPSGYLADRFGRRNSVVWGQILLTLGWVAYAFAGDLASLVAVEMLLGVGLSLISGANSALRYDSLLALGDEKSFIKREGAANWYGALSEGFTGLASSAIVLISLQATVYAQAIWAVTTILPVFWLVEAPLSGERPSALKPWSGFSILRSSVLMRWLIMYSAIINTSTYTAVWLMQPYYEEVGVALGLFGVLWLAKHLVLAFFSRSAHWFDEKLGFHRIIVILPLIVVATYVVLGLGYSVWFLWAFAGLDLVRGVQSPVLRGKINDLIPSSHIRATVLSTQSLVVKIAQVIFTMLMAYLASRTGTQHLILFSAVIYGPFLGLAAFGTRSALNQSKRR